MKISDKNPGEKAIIAEGPAKGREVEVTMKGDGRLVGIKGDGSGQTVRGDLEVE